jgi:hypothetical protein
MRELSVIELDLIVGGYGESGGSFDEAAYESAATNNSDGSYSLEVSESEYNMQAQAAQADGWTIGGTVSTGPNGTTVTVTASHSS